MTQSGGTSAHPRICVKNLTREQTLVTAGRAADNHWTRRPGLIGDQPLAQEWTPQIARRAVLNVPYGTEIGLDPLLLWRSCHACKTYGV